MTTINWMNTSRADVTGSLAFSDPKVTSTGMKVVDVAFGTKWALLQTPQLQAPFGAKSFEPGKFQLYLRLAPTKAGDHEKARVETFMAMLKAIDQAVIDHVFQNQEEVLGVSGKSKEIITDRYTHLVKEKIGYEPAFSLKFDKKYEVYNAAKQAKLLEDITKDSLNVALVRLSHVWANAKGFGVCAKVMQVMTKPVEKISGCAIDPNLE